MMTVVCIEKVLTILALAPESKSSWMTELVITANNHWKHSVKKAEESRRKEGSEPLVRILLHHTNYRQVMSNLSSLNHSKTGTE